jgi:hypothetical protein
VKNNIIELYILYFVNIMHVECTHTVIYTYKSIYRYIYLIVLVNYINTRDENSILKDEGEVNLNSSRKNRGKVLEARKINVACHRRK